MEDHDVGPMSWDAARDLARRVGAIGAHSLRHAILICKTEASTLSDVEQNIAEVSSEIGTPRKSFAFHKRNYTERLCTSSL
jgi:ubiquinone biosynthesis protein UbiJ